LTQRRKDLAAPRCRTPQFSKETSIAQAACYYRYLYVSNGYQ
jgi:hypothetical protein